MRDGLQTEVTYVKGVGPRVAPLFHRLGVRTVEDLLYHLPRRYQDRRNLPGIGEVKAGQVVTIRGKIRRIDSRPVGGGRVLIQATVEDRTGAIHLTWFNQPWVKRQLEVPGAEIIAYGLVKPGRQLDEMASPEWELIDPEEDAQNFARIVPVYPLTEGLPQRTVRNAVQTAVEQCVHLLVDPLPESILAGQKLRDLSWSIRTIHSPSSEEARVQARRRLVFEEFLYMQLELAMRRLRTQMELGIRFPIERLIEGGPVEVELQSKVGKSQRRTGATGFAQDLFAAQSEAIRSGEPLWDQLSRMLPFPLTGAQRRVIDEIFGDMARPHPMNRLVQGDVGSGKTAVAACCMVAAVRSGFQCAMMAPTEILAEQHAHGLRKLLAPLEIPVDLLVGKLGSRERKRVQARLQDCSASIVVGTHALIQEGVTFGNLGFVVIDEQHRFGVLQRKAMRDKGFGNPDVLVMTATPIPRTIAMTTYGDLDVSVIDELPAGRKPIRTHLKRPSDRASVYETVRQLIGQGRQAYFVCPMVGESEKMLAQAATELHAHLKESVFSDFRVGLVHGQMKPVEKEEVMAAFYQRELDVLVATTVIEVGVDVPNASVMVIEDAHRFGLAQLHQLRGRVGRGEHQSYCILIADLKGEEASKRMEIMVETTDGFRIAEADFELRGPGNLAGTEQSGHSNLRFADLVRDSGQLEIARKVAQKIVAADPDLADPEMAKVRGKIQARRSDTALLTVS